MALYQAPRRRKRTSVVPDVPATSRDSPGHRIRWMIAGLVLPICTAAALVPFRDDIDRSAAALTLVVPVVIVALRGGRGPAAAAAVVAPLAFDVLLTRPYQQLEIAVAADVEATVILAVVGVTVAAVVSQASRDRTLATVRGREVRSLELAAAVARERGGSDAMAARAGEALTELLELRSCRWSPGYRGAAYPVLTADGEVAGRPAEDRAPLPSTGAEIPVHAAGREIGRFVVVPSSSRPVSREERLVALTIADLFGRAHGAREPDDEPAGHDGWRPGWHAGVDGRIAGVVSPDEHVGVTARRAHRRRRDRGTVLRGGHPAGCCHRPALQR